MVVVAHVWGARLFARVPETHLAFAPLVAFPRTGVAALAIVPVAAGTAGVLLLPRLAPSVGWRGLMLLSFAGAAAWAVALALVDGPGGLTASLHLPNDYSRDIALVAHPGSFLRGFVRGVNRFEFVQHVRSHPPGALLVLSALRGVGLGGTGAEAALFIVGGAAAGPAALVAVRDVAGEAGARAAAPFLILAPAAVWVATSGDALFAGVAAWAVACIVLATGPRGRPSTVLAVAGGLLFGAAVMLSYGVALLATVPLAVAAWRRRPAPLLVAAGCAAIILLAFRVEGFWWPDGLHAAVRSYRLGISRLRPQSYFWFGDLAAFAIAVGPAAALALARLHDGRAWLLVGAGLAAVAVADVTGLSKGEVERIWLPFVPWVLVATAAFAHQLNRASARVFLAANVLVAVAVQTGLRPTW